MSRPRITLCVIARDEEEMLPGCLAPARDAVDRMIVVDTGSSDRTVEIARRMGARVVEHEWSDDFAAARNAALEHVKSGFILHLDADERLAHGAGTTLRQAVRKGGFDLGRCLERAETLREETIMLGEVLDRILENPGSLDDEKKEEVFTIANRALMAIGRVLIPMNYTKVDPFDQDLAVPMRPIPALQPLRELNSHSPESDAYHFLYTRLVRESNKICHALKQAAEKARKARLKLEGI